MNLEVGNRIYRTEFRIGADGDISAVYTVERVTNTLAICEKNNRFKREIGNNGRIESFPTDHGWSRPQYELETPELLNRLHRQSL